MKKSVCFLLGVFITFSIFAQRPIVQDIQAQAGRGAKINISWTLPKNPDKPITNFLIYRNTQQINSYQMLQELTPIAQVTPEATGYTDTVSDFNDYFYAVIAVTDKPYDLILLSFNATVTGTHVAIKTDNREPERLELEKLYPEGTLRETPLPYVDLIDGIVKPEIISDETVNQTNSLITAAKKKKPLLKQYIFEEDLISPDAGDDFLLFEILKTTFVQKKYNEAISQLNKLVGTNIGESTRNRAYFYIGESEYLLGHYENAVRIFVKLESVYPILAKKWLESALDRI